MKWVAQNPEPAAMAAALSQRIRDSRDSRTAKEKRVQASRLTRKQIAAASTTNRKS